MQPVEAGCDYPGVLRAMSRCRRRTFAGAMACAASVAGCARGKSDAAQLGDGEPSPAEVARGLARRFVARSVPHRMPWRWDAAIGTLGLSRLVASSVALPQQDEQRIVGFLDAYVRHHRGRVEVSLPDRCAPALTALTAAPWLEPDLVHEAIEPVATFLRAEPRNRLGALDHLGTDTAIAALYPRSIWIDSIMMYGLTAVEVGRWCDDEALRAFGYAQPGIFAAVLQDPARGLFRHAYLLEPQRCRPQAPVFWLRGNGWVAAALADMLAHYHRSFSSNLAIFERLVDALMGHQNQSGLWNTVIGDGRTYEEPSGSALVAYALAKGWRLGLLPERARQAAQRAFVGLARTVRSRPDGLSLPGISGPTIPLARAGYALVPRSPDLDYGVGAVLMLATELQSAAAPVDAAQSGCRAA